MTGKGFVREAALLALSGGKGNGVARDVEASGFDNVKAQTQDNEGYMYLGAPCKFDNPKAQTQDKEGYMSLGAPCKFDNAKAQTQDKEGCISLGAPTTRPLENVSSAASSTTFCAPVPRVCPYFDVRLWVLSESVNVLQEKKSSNKIGVLSVDPVQQRLKERGATRKSRILMRMIGRTLQLLSTRTLPRRS